MIFSLLKIRKKTSAVLAGIAIGAASLWGLSLWLDISRQEIFSLLGATVLFLLLIILLAVGLITLIKLASLGLTRLFTKQADEDSANTVAPENISKNGKQDS